MAKYNNKGRNFERKSFAGIPRIVMDCSDYKGLPYSAKALLFELAYQYNGRNNGNLTVGIGTLKKRGWKRPATISTAISKLIEANLVTRTRESQFHNPDAKCALYAINWQNIDECCGKNLDAKPTITPLRKFSLEKK